MSTYKDLPASAVRLYKKPPSIRLSSLATPAQKATARETWRVPFGDETKFLQAVYGFPETVGGPSGAVIRRVGLKHPEFPGLLATDCEGQRGGYDGSLQSETHPNGFWKYTDFVVDFATPAYELSGANAFLSLSGVPSQRQFPGPASGFRLNGSPPPFDPGEYIFGEDFTFTTHNLPTLPMAVYDSCRDCANSTPFPMPNGVTRPIGTILYNGCTYNQTSSLDGSQTWDVAHSFSFNPIGWNFVYFNGILGELTRADGSRPKLLKNLTAVFNA